MGPGFLERGRVVAGPEVRGLVPRAGVLLAADPARSAWDRRVEPQRRRAEPRDEGCRPRRGARRGRRRQSGLGRAARGRRDERTVRRDVPRAVALVVLVVPLAALDPCRRLSVGRQRARPREMDAGHRRELGHGHLQRSGRPLGAVGAAVTAVGDARRRDPARADLAPDRCAGNPPVGERADAAARARA